MTSLTDTAPRSLTDRRLMLCIAILVAVTVVRLIGLAYSQVDLFFDELQYWAWSRELAFGYFSKPPLLSWVIAGAEAVCGSSEACIRAPAPVLYLGTCLGQLRHRQDAVRRDDGVLVGDAADVQRRARVFEPHHLDRCAAALPLGRRALVLREAAAGRRLALGPAARRVVRARHAGEIRDDLFRARHRRRGGDRSRRARAVALAVAVARRGGRRRVRDAERDLERAEQLRHADPCRPQHPGRRCRLRSDEGTGIHREPVRGVRSGDVQRAADRAGAGDETGDRPRRPFDAVLRAFPRCCW